MNNALKTKREILNTRLLARIEKTKELINNVNVEFIRQQQGLNDVIVPNRYENFNFFYDKDLRINLDGEIKGVTKFAVNQMLDKMNIPVKYFKNLLLVNDDSRQLALDTINSHIHSIAPKKLLVRSINDTVHGILSSRYKRFDSFFLIQEFFKLCKANGLEPVDSFINENCFHYDFIYPDIIEVETKNSGIIPLVLGITLKNSDFGFSKLEMNVKLFNVLCLNGMVGQKLISATHLGAEMSENIQYSNKTIRLDTEAKVSQIYDTIGNIRDGKLRDQMLEKVLNLASTPINYVDELERLNSLNRISKEDQTNLLNIFMSHKESDGIVGEPSKWNMLQGLTAYGRDLTSYKKREFEEMAMMYNL